MTREEAIEYLNRLYMKAAITDAYGDLDDTEPYDMAVDMAIEALKAEQDIDSAYAHGYTDAEAHFRAYENHKWHSFRQEQDSGTGIWEFVEPLPKEGQHILVTIALDGHEPVQDDYWHTDGFGCWLDSGYCIGDEAIAWMPLPESYREDE